jgi:hypothetical protein
LIVKEGKNMLPAVPKDARRAAPWSASQGVSSGYPSIETAVAAMQHIEFAVHGAYLAP